MPLFISTIALLATTTIPIISPQLATTGSALLPPSFLATPEIVALVASSTAEMVGVDLKDLATKIAFDNKIPTSTLFNMVESESGWGEDAKDSDIPGDWNPKLGVYCSWGLVQINVCANNDPDKPGYATKEQAIDPAFALQYAAHAIKVGDEDRWTSCNCYSLVWTKIKHLPAMRNIVPNSYMRVGNVAIFYLHDKKTGALEKHIGLITKANASGTVGEMLQANKSACLIETVAIHLSDYGLVGFWSPSGV